MKKIKATCKAADLLPIDSLEELQGDLKKISKKNLDKLKKRIIKDGINVPLFVWRQDDWCRILDGHQRLKALLSLRQDGYELPLLPVAYIEAENEKDAKQKLLGITSQYGEFEIEQLDEWLSEFDDEIKDTLRIVDSELELKNYDFDIINNDDLPLSDSGFKRTSKTILVLHDYYIIVDKDESIKFREDVMKLKEIDNKELNYKLFKKIEGFINEILYSK